MPLSGGGASGDAFVHQCPFRGSVEPRRARSVADGCAVLSGPVDAVVVDYSSSKLDVWERVHFDVLYKGDDWRGTAKGNRLESEMASVGAEVRYFPYTAHTSSTALRQILASR